MSSIAGVCSGDGVNVSSIAGSGVDSTYASKCICRIIINYFTE